MGQGRPMACHHGNNSDQSDFDDSRKLYFDSIRAQPSEFAVVEVLSIINVPGDSFRQ